MTTPSVVPRMAVYTMTMCRLSCSDSSTASWSLLNTDSTRPMGVIVKNSSGARSTRANMVLCIMVAARPAMAYQNRPRHSRRARNRAT
jgi:hypothetical protein